LKYSSVKVKYYFLGNRICSQVVYVRKEQGLPDILKWFSKVKQLNFRQMKRVLLISCLILIIAMTGFGCRHIRGRMHERFFHERMGRDFREMEFRHPGRHGMDREMGPDCFTERGHRQGMHPGMGPGFMDPDRIPGLTDKQRQDIADLRNKHMQEMDKFHEETFSRLQNIREEQRKAMMNILTDEQKKFLEQAAPGAPSGK
jgi:hypothetical protein